ncbi:MAG: hypothetical protein ACI4FY_00595 [Acetatifactor sp.]
MSVKQKKIVNWIELLMLFIALGLYLAAAHDMQTAKGIGLYLGMELGTDRKVWDLVADGVRLLGLMLCVMLPALWLKKWDLGCMFRITVMELALLPVFDEATFLHFLLDDSVSRFQVTLNRASLVLSVQKLMEPIGIILPLLFLLCMAASVKGNDRTSLLGRRRTVAVLVLSAVLLLIDVVMRGLSFAASFLLCYIPVCLICGKAEEFFADDGKTQMASFALYGLLWLRVVYRMMFVLESF